jgi:hypothetical protein
VLCEASCTQITIDNTSVWPIQKWASGTKLNQGTITQEDFDPARIDDPDAINNFATIFSLS